MEDVQTDKWPSTDVTQFECPRRTISDPVMESGSCNWCYNKKKAPTMQQPLGVWQKDVLPPATRASRRMCQLPVTVCTTDGQRAALFVDRLSFPDPQLSEIPLCIARNGSQTEQSSGFQIHVPCKQSILPPTPKKNMLSQLAWLTRIPNRPCMYVGQRSMLAAAGELIVCAPYLLASITFCRRCNISVEGRQQHMRL